MSRTAVMGSPHRASSDPDRTKFLGRYGLFGLLTFGLLGLVVLCCPGVANATWDGHCNNESHCYALGEWVMGSGEEVEADILYVDTEAMNVPEPSNYNFIDNETWASWHSYPGWVEVGQTSGWPRETTNELFPFWAYENSSGTYEEFVNPRPYGEPANNYNLYQLVYRGSGIWCMLWAEGTARCVGGMPGYATVLQGGVEAATDSNPENVGNTIAQSMWLGGSVHGWEGAYHHGEPYYEYPATCSADNGHGWGSVTFNAGVC